MKKILGSSNYYGKFILLIGFLIAIPLLVIPFYPMDGKDAMSFLIPAVFSIILGSLICVYGKVKVSEFNFQLNNQSGSFLVLFAWAYGIVMGGLPFVISGQLNIVQALFEAVSGWTTTGLSVLDVTQTNHIFLFHRGFMQYCGGLGFVMMMVMFVQGKQAMSMYNAEGHPDKLVPNLKKTARIILVLYLAFLVGGTLLYMIFGMNLFEGLQHAMCSLSTGGFSTRLESIGAYNSVAIEAITIVLMLIGTTNFAVLLLLVKGKFRQFFKVSEMKFLFALLAVFVPLSAFSLFYGLYLNMFESFRHALFNVVSALSTTGYATLPFDKWPAFAIGVLILMMIFGGGIGSTAGGIKLSRVYLTMRITFNNMRRRMFPTRQLQKSYFYKAQGKTPIDEALAFDTTSYVFAYLVIYVAGTLLLTAAANCSLTEAMFDFASSLGTVGLSIGITNPMTSSWALIIEMVGMMLGRLEIFVVFIGIHSGYNVLRHRFQKQRKTY